LRQPLVLLLLLELLSLLFLPREQQVTCTTAPPFGLRLYPLEGLHV